MPARPIDALCATSSVLVLAQCLLPLAGNTVEREVVRHGKNSHLFFLSLFLGEESRRPNWERAAGQEFGISEMTRQDIPGVFTTRKALQGVFDLQITKMVGNE